ncbi:iron hydrogenase [Ruminococcus sp. AF18-22]|jgi:NADH-quinone oxidoreductase subunit E|nr:iron hydrogenase [Ruminococcus sp. AF18-22]
MELSEQERQTEEILSYYSTQKDRAEQSVIVQMLQELKEVNAVLTEELKSRAAQATGVSLSFIDLLIRTYPSLKKSACAHEITVCSGERCGRKKGAELIAQIRKELQIGKNNISCDGKYYLKVQNCLKQCRTSPNFMIDKKIYKNVRPEDIHSIFSQYGKK